MTESPYQELIAATGLPEQQLTKEIDHRLRKMNVEPEEASLENLREVVSDYLLDVIAQLMEPETSAL